MNFLQYEEKIVTYMAALYFFVNIENKNSYSSKELLNFFISYKFDSNIINVLNNGTPKDFMKHKLWYLNQINILKDGRFYIPNECFLLLKNSVITFKDNSFFLTFNNKEDWFLFNKWKNIERINNFIYTEKSGSLKEIINKGLKGQIIEELSLDNKINISYSMKKTSNAKSVSSQYKYEDEFDGLITLILEKYYIDLYDIFDSVFLDEEICFNNIKNKINKNLIVQKMKKHNIYYNEDLLKEKVNFYFFKNFN